jgi:CubicO group peptidase (beta-lactamase class C family)
MSFPMRVAYVGLVLGLLFLARQVTQSSAGPTKQSDSKAPAPTLATSQNQPYTQDWQTTDAQKIGLVPANLQALDRDIARGKFGLLDNVTFIRCGKIGYERSFPHDYGRIYRKRIKKEGPLNHDPTGEYNYFSPEFHPFYRGSDLHTMQSVTKTITSVIIGIAIMRGDFPSDLDTPAIKFFADQRVANLDDRKRRITLRHLLTMTSGIEWHEDLHPSDPRNSVDIMESRHDWVQYAIDPPMATEPGTVWAYSSGSTQLLSYIFKHATGKKIDEYAGEYLFKPLNIRYHWKLTPTGLPDTEGGLYLSYRDLAKIGYLFLNNGKWNAQQIVSSEWVKTSITPHVSTIETPAKFGYNWWLHPYGNDQEQFAWAAHGFGQQHLVIFPDYHLIVVLTGWDILPSKRDPERGWLERMLSTVDKQRSCEAREQ